MLKSIYPNLFLESVYEINIEKLKRNGIRGIIFDIDNTLVPMYQKAADKKIIDYLKSFEDAGIKVSIVSNARKKRVENFRKGLTYYTLYRARKPGKKGFVKAAAAMKLPLNEVAVVGDQLFTDIKGGNKLGMFTILVKPIDRKEIITVRLKRLLEKIILFSCRE